MEGFLLGYAVVSTIGFIIVVVKYEFTRQNLKIMRETHQDLAYENMNRLNDYQQVKGESYHYKLGLERVNYESDDIKAKKISRKYLSSKPLPF